MRRRASARRRPEPRDAPCGAQRGGGGGGGRAALLTPRKLPPGSGTPWVLLLFLLAGGASPCKGAPVASHSPHGEQELQMWNEINDACSTYLTSDTSPQSVNTLEDLCVMVLDLVQKTQELDEKDNTKRFLFHYTKTHETGNSDTLSSVLHPLLQLVPQLHERRLKRYKEDDKLRIPGGIQSTGYFIFRPRNGRRSAPFR